MCRAIDHGGRRCPGGGKATARSPKTKAMPNGKNGAPTVAAWSSKPSPEFVTDCIRDAYQQVGKPGSLVSLTVIRRALEGTGATRADIDGALDEMVTDPDVRVVSDANRKALTDEDRESAVEIGGQLKHLIAIYQH